MQTQASVALLATNSVFMVLAIVSVAVRLWVRKRLDYGADDYLIVASLFFSVFLAVVNIVGVPIAHVGEPFSTLDEIEAESYLKIAFVIQFPYVITVALVKLSVLSFYGRIFQLGQWPPLIKILLFVTSAWLIAFLFATLFQAWPVQCNWLPCLPTTDYAAMYLACSATNVLLDIAILATPMAFLSRVRMSRSQKVGVVGIFGLGIFCVVASICRLVYAAMFEQVDLADYSINFDVPAVNIIMWSGIEASASTICANLPTYHPLFARLRRLALRPGRGAGGRGPVSLPPGREVPGASPQRPRPLQRDGAADFAISENTLFTEALGRSSDKGGSWQMSTPTRSGSGEWELQLLEKEWEENKSRPRPCDA